MRAALLLLCLSAWAQDLPVVRGVLVRRDPGVRSGVLTLRADGNLVLRYGFDPHTYIERDNRSIDAADLRPGEPLEVVSEAVPGTALRAARSIHVISAAPVQRHSAAMPPVATERRGEMSFSGLVLRSGPGTLVLRPRQGADLELLLVSVTRCLENGDQVPLDRLAPGMRVFVRAGRNDVSGKLEAHQVLWGTMLEPK